MKDGTYFESWLKLDLCDKRIETFHKIGGNFKKYEKLDFINTKIPQFQKLFPYRDFLSRELYVKRYSCSICKKNIAINNPCEHETGKLYGGYICNMVIEEANFNGIAFVKDPVDKYSVAFIEGYMYNYDTLKSFIDVLDSPFERWDITLEIVENRKFNNLGRNDKCFCGSDKKFKKCCINESTVEEYRIILYDKDPETFKAFHIDIDSVLKEVLED